MKEYRGKLVVLGLNIVLFVISFRVFYVLGLWELSDLLAHSEFAVELLKITDTPYNEFVETLKYPHLLTYPIWHISYLIIRGLLWPLKAVIENLGFLFLQTIAGITTSIFLLINYNLYQKYFNKFMYDKNKVRDALFALAIIVTGPYYLPMESSYTLGKGIVTPWHNPTTIAVISVVIISFFLYVKLYEENENNDKRKENLNFILFSFLILISALIKPSFYQMFVPALVLFCVMEFILSKGKKFFFCLKTAFSILPVCLLALFQMSLTFDSNNSTGGLGGVGFDIFKVLRGFTNHPVISICASLVFPIFVLGIYLVNKSKDTMVILAACALASGLGQYTVLYFVKSPGTGDFAWGFYISIGLLFFSTVVYFYNICKLKKYRYIKIIGWLLYLPHVFFGLLHFLNMLDPAHSIQGNIYFDF